MVRLDHDWMHLPLIHVNSIMCLAWVHLKSCPWLLMEDSEQWQAMRCPVHNSTPTGRRIFNALPSVCLTAAHPSWEIEQNIGALHKIIALNSQFVSCWWCWWFCIAVRLMKLWCNLFSSVPDYGFTDARPPSHQPCKSYLDLDKLGFSRYLWRTRTLREKPRPRPTTTFKPLHRDQHWIPFSGFDDQKLLSCNCDAIVPWNKH